jgi:predicted DNA-binding transcriptional regulator AlpA
MAAAVKRRVEPLWSHQETAEFLGIPAATLHQLNYKGTGPRSYKVGRWRKYDRADVQAWLESRASDRATSA